MATDPTAPSIYPTLRYDDAPAAIAFLRDTLGLRAESVTEDPDGKVLHATLAWGNGLIMVSSRFSAEDTFDTSRACLYLAIGDPDAHHARALAAGAEVVMGLTDQPYGSREFAVRDAEGMVWCFGTYQPAVTGVTAEPTVMAAPE
ncbi:MAG: bleomycin resistance protein [Acidimicrobiia bacterium]|nr:bleomycin resistance protein [Acidimicrobiia bacterium]